MRPLWPSSAVAGQSKTASTPPGRDARSAEDAKRNVASAEIFDWLVSDGADEVHPSLLEGVARAREMVVRSCSRQGLPVGLADPIVVAQVVAALTLVNNPGGDHRNTNG